MPDPKSKTPKSQAAAIRAGRTADRVLAHYEVEKALAARLKDSTKEERRTLYSTLYDQLYMSVPDHPQLLRRASGDEAHRYTMFFLRLVERYLVKGGVFLEIGPGDCALSLQVAQFARHVYAVDVSDEVTTALPDNCTLILSDGSSVPVPVESVDFAFSNQLMEHLHPDDAVEQLENIHRALRSGGRYLCVTPNRMLGPHDVSVFFDREATGFHLKEYTYGELTALFERVGFTRMTALIGAKGRHAAVPASLAVLLERLCASLPRSMVRARPLRTLLLNVILLGTK